MGKGTLRHARMNRGASAFILLFSFNRLPRRLALHLTFDLVFSTFNSKLAFPRRLYNKRKRSA